MFRNFIYNYIINSLYSAVLADSADPAMAESLPTIHDNKTIATSNSPQKPETLASGNSGSKESNIDFKVIYNKKKYDVSLSPDMDIGALKTHLQPIIDIPPAMMKVTNI